MDDERGYCKGCFRTLDEISNWSKLSDGRKRAVLAAVAKRRAHQHDHHQEYRK